MRACFLHPACEAVGRCQVVAIVEVARFGRDRGRERGDRLLVAPQSGQHATQRVERQRILRRQCQRPVRGFGGFAVTPQQDEQPGEVREVLGTSDCRSSAVSIRGTALAISPASAIVTPSRK